MSSSPSTPDRFQLYERTVAQMGRRVGSVRSPTDLMTALRWGMSELDTTFAQTAPAVRAVVACRAGCDACCRVPVDVQAHEVLFAADHIQIHFSPEALNDVVARLAVHRQQFEALNATARETSRSTCVLLSAGSCSIYAGRPEACRSHHTRDAAACQAHLVDPTVDISKVYVPELRARMFAVMLGIDEALEARGYDDRAYDFGSALHEALTSPLCLVAWSRRQLAFPDSCLADRFDQN